jgi:protease I
MPIPARAIILTASWFEDLEVLYPLYRLREAGCVVHVAAPRATTIRGSHGYKLTPDMTIENVDAEHYDLLILPGGPPFAAAKTVSKNARAVAITRTFMQSNKLVASICHGPYTLVASNTIRGKRLTSYPGHGVPKRIQQAGGVWEDAEVMVDGNLITSRLPEDLPAFMRAIFSSARG